MIKKLKEHQFLIEELIKRDFKKKYKRTALGMLWSVLSPLLSVLVLMLVFTAIFARRQPHFIIYIFSGTLVMNFYTEATNGGMRALMANASIFTKINVPKYLFLLSKNIQSLINFFLTLLLYLVFCLFDRIHFGPHMFLLIFPIICMTVFQFGVGMILSAMFVFFRDVEYLYSIFLMLLNYVSAIFYPVEIIPESYRMVLLLNPVYVYIRYFRDIVINEIIPSPQYHGLCLFYALFFLAIGCYMYVRYNHEFLYYV